MSWIKLSPGTLYPILHKLQEVRLLKQHSVLVEGEVRKYQRTTVKRATLWLKGKIKELTDEIYD